jgi:2-keto-4-pentenoate hydratase
MDAIDALDAVADRIAAAYETFEPIPPVRAELEPGGVSAALAVQQRVAARWLAAGRRVVGRQIGLTSEAVSGARPRPRRAGRHRERADPFDRARARRRRGVERDGRGLPRPSYRAALWLARRVAAEGTPRRAGAVVMTGALGPMRPLVAGTDVVATLSGLGTVRTSLDEEGSTS